MHCDVDLTGSSSYRRNKNRSTAVIHSHDCWLTRDGLHHTLILQLLGYFFSGWFEVSPPLLWALTMALQTTSSIYALIFRYDQHVQRLPKASWYGVILRSAKGRMTVSYINFFLSLNKASAMMRFLNVVIYYFALTKWPSWFSTSCPYAENSWHTGPCLTRYRYTGS